MKEVDLEAEYEGKYVKYSLKECEVLLNFDESRSRRVSDTEVGAYWQRRRDRRERDGRRKVATRRRTGVLPWNRVFP
eukprot:3224934-Heterocapsa_arctica.AAC.1